MKVRYIFPADYMADPAAKVFNGRVFIYPSHDIESGHSQDDDGGHFQMKDYHVLSMDNVMEGDATDHGEVLNVANIPWAEQQMWDNDCVEKDGKYYLVFAAKDYSGVFHLGVAVSDKPEGPFTPQPDPIRGSYSIDPSMFKDDDGSIYCYFGGIWGGQLQCYKNNRLIENPVLPKGTEIAICPRMAKMTDDVLQFAEAPREIVILDENGERMLAEDPHHFFEASWMHKYNGKYYYSYSTGDTHLICYAVADNPYGPFTYKGTLLEPVVGWTSHHSIVEYKGKWYLFHHDSVPSGGKTWLRSLKVCEIVYDEEGNMKTV